MESKLGGQIEGVRTPENIIKNTMRSQKNFLRGIESAIQGGFMMQMKWLTW